MKDGEPVWFGCDVGKRSTRESGVMDTKIFALEDLFQTDFPMTKAQRLDYGQSLIDPRNGIPGREHRRKRTA